MSLKCAFKKTPIDCRNEEKYTRGKGFRVCVHTYV